MFKGSIKFREQLCHAVDHRFRIYRFSMFSMKIKRLYIAKGLLAFKRYRQARFLLDWNVLLIGLQAPSDFGGQRRGRGEGVWDRCRSDVPSRKNIALCRNAWSLKVHSKPTRSGLCNFQRGKGWVIWHRFAELFFSQIQLPLPLESQMVYP